MRAKLEQRPDHCLHGIALHLYHHLLLVLVLMTSGASCMEAASDLPDAGMDATASSRDGGTAEPDAEDGPPIEGILDLYLSGAAADFDALKENPHDRDLEIQVALLLGGRTYPKVEMEVHGGISREFPKLSFRLRFPKDNPLETTVFSGDLESHRRIVLQASWIDPTFSRNCLTMDLVRELGGLAPRCQYANLWFNGAHHGFYTLIERVDETYLERQGFNPDGLLIKAESHRANWQAKEDPMDGFAQKGNSEAPTDMVGALLEILNNTPATHQGFEQKVAPVLDLGDFMTWQMAHTFADNRDTFTKNYYLYLDWERSGARFRVVSWDADSTWGRNWDGAAVEPTTTRWHGNDHFSPRLFSISEYRGPYLNGYADCLNEPQCLEALLDNAAERRTRIEAAARRDLDVWGRGMDFDAEFDGFEEAIQQRFDTMRASLPQQ